MNLDVVCIGKEEAQSILDSGMTVEECADYLTNERGYKVYIYVWEGISRETIERIVEEGMNRALNQAEGDNDAIQH